jgi:hypothetical protein
MTTALEGGEGSAPRPGRSLPPGRTRYPLYRRLGGPQGRSGQVRKISPPPGFDPRTVQPVASRYTDWATRPTRWVLPYAQVLHNVRYLHDVSRFLLTSAAWAAPIVTGIQFTPQITSIYLQDSIEVIHGVWHAVFLLLETRGFFCCSFPICSNQ